MNEIPDVESLGERLGQELAVSDWIEITQQRIDGFADVTEDRQWIHVDPGRAAVDSPFKAPVAHGFLTLSLVSVLSRRALALGRVQMAVNYGLNRVRFVSPVPAGARIRGRFTPIAVKETGGGVQVTWRVNIEREHTEKPCVVAEWIVRYFPTGARTEPPLPGHRQRTS